MSLSPAEYSFILRRDFLSFAERAFYELNPERTLACGPHIELMAARLDDCRLGECNRLIINVPPRHLKSHLASIAFPAWYLGHHPSGKIASVCYGQELAERFARECRRLMMSRFYQRLFRTRLAERQAVHDFETSDGGVRFATSVGGPFTGRGADIIIVDDPTKPEDALSEPRRQGANMWFDNTLRSRLDDKMKGCIIIVMQRQHQDDLVGHVLQREAWETIVFPAIATADETHVIETPLGRRTYERRVGEALHPEREPLEELLRMRDRMGSYTFSSQYQQSPIPLEGAIVKAAWLKFYKSGEEPARFDHVVQSWDTANKRGESNDYCACVTIGVKGKQLYVLHVYRERLDYPELKRKVIEYSQRYPNTTILIEDKASGTQLIQELKTQVIGVKAYEPPSDMDKEARLRVQTTVIEQGLFLLPESAPFLSDYITELTGFPGTAHDDQVDATAQALAYIRGEATDLEVWSKLGRGGSFNLRSPLGLELRPWTGPYS